MTKARSLTKALAVIMAISIVSGCSSLPTRSEKVVVAHPAFETMTLLFVADEKGYFARNGIDLELSERDTGAASLDAVIAGDADLAVGTSEFPLVRKAFDDQKVSALASIDELDFISLVARKDRGILKPADLKGKRIGVTRGTISEFFLGRFLELNGMTIRDVKLVDLKTPAEWTDAVVTGDVDAVVTAEPQASMAKDRLGENAVVFPAQSSQALYALIIARDEWISAHPELAQRFLKAMVRAEKYVAENPEDAKAILQERLDLDAGEMDKVWSRNQYIISLDRSMVLAMEDEARWMIKNGLVPEQPALDVIDHIKAGSLEAVEPEAVHLFP